MPLRRRAPAGGGTYRWLSDRPTDRRVYLVALSFVYFALAPSLLRFAFPAGFGLSRTLTRAGKETHGGSTTSYENSSSLCVFRYFVHLEGGEGEGERKEVAGTSQREYLVESVCPRRDCKTRSPINIDIDAFGVGEREGDNLERVSKRSVAIIG